MDFWHRLQLKWAESQRAQMTLSSSRPLGLIQKSIGPSEEKQIPHCYVPKTPLTKKQLKN